MEQDDLFGSASPSPPVPVPAKPGAVKVRPGKAPASAAVRAALLQDDHLALAARLPPRLRLGTSSWTYPGWTGLIWAEDYAESKLSRHGLSAYAQHPLMRTVSIDRSFYRAMTAAQYATHAAQVPADFRFMVKAPSSVADALVRDGSGRGMQRNPLFLDPELACREFVEPALDGLGDRLGVLVFQLSPLPPYWLAHLPETIERLSALLHALPALAARSPEAIVAVQIRDETLLHAPGFTNVLRDAGATYCLGLHPKMPPIEGQLPILRALWPGPLVCRWNLHARHGRYGYESAQQLYEPYNRLQDPDVETRRTLIRVARATVDAGHPAYIAISNKAEGCAPLSVVALAQDYLATNSDGSRDSR